MKFEKVKAGDVLFDAHTFIMGHTRLRSWAVWTVHVIDKYDDHAVVSWNGNAPERVYPRYFKKLRVKKPRLVRCGLFGQKRLARRDDPPEGE